MVEVIVEYEYEAHHEDELTLRQGDIITNVRRIEEEGWMEGELNGRRGVFPDNFVKEVRRESKGDVKEAKEAKEVKEETQVTRRSAGNVASLVQRISTYGIPTGGLGLQPHFQPRGSTKKPRKRHCKALFEYVPQNEDELELKTGDIIEVTGEVEEGWWSGLLNGKSGLFPSNFVKEMDPSEDGETNEGSDEFESKDESTGPTSPHHGNGVIAQPKKVKGVGFGDIFREGSVKLKVRLPSETDEKKEKPIPSLPLAAKPSHVTSSDSAKVESENKTKEYCKVAFPYEATNQDELDLKEGDIIHILSKDTGEPGWWRGEVNGREGVFPDNFVMAISDTEKEKDIPASRGSVKISPKPELEEKPRKPPPPSKSIAPKPDPPSVDKKPPQSKPEDKVDKPLPEHKTSKPAPVVPPKKPIPLPGKGLPRPGSVLPKRPDKPLTPSLSTKHNGEVPPTRPKSEFEPTLTSKPKTLPGELGEKSSDVDLMSFDDVSSTSEKLSHLTANRPKMPGRRLPAQFGGGQSPSRETTEKTLKVEEELDASRPKSVDVPKPSISTPSPAPAQKAAPVTATVATPEPKPKAEADEEKGAEVEDLRAQMKELLLSIELLKSQQSRELAELRNELDDEKLRRVTLQMEIEKLKKAIQLT
ncbi:CD2-associated protein isoform X2 [Chanos chanos]|uniref:Osteoclast-stimulating factor 1 n=1 Tax=Chanos chanos TaxID=29144 RepID=A0A6J2V821_CHACN|nr:CD2-associated protein isoform X2 [Chanos chanos]